MNYSYTQAGSLAPGVLVVDVNNTLLHSNSEAIAIITKLKKYGMRKPRRLPVEIVSLCDRLKSLRPGDPTVDSEIYAYTEERVACAVPYRVRAFFINNPGVSDQRRSIMVLIEPILEKRRIDLELTKEEYGLSRKEFEVLRYICQGLPNRGIAKAMCISEYTVKGHVKKIMDRTGLRSRQQIMAAVL